MEASLDNTAETRPKVLVMGKLPPPLMGPSLATKIILESTLNEDYELLHIDTSAHPSLGMIGKWDFDKVGNNLRMYRKTYAILKAERPDLALIPMGQGTLGFVKDSVFVLLCRLFGCPAVLQLRGCSFGEWRENAPGIVRAYTDWVVRGSQGGIVLGDNLRNLFADLLPPDKIFVVPNGADYTFPEPTVATDHKVRLLFLSNLKPSKGLVDLLNVMAHLEPAVLESVHLDVVGDWRSPEYEQECRTIAAERELPVTFHPPATGDTKFRFFADADIFLLPTHWKEGHPWAIVEAMAAGLPVISTDEGAIVESVIHGKNGYIVDPKNVNDFAARLTALIVDPDLRKEFGEAGRRHYLNNFTESGMVAKLDGTFRSVLAKDHREVINPAA